MLNITKIVYNGAMSMDDYLAYDALSSSKLNAVADCPARALQDHDETSSTTLGTLTHTMLLEPHQFEQMEAMPEFKLNTNAGKDEMIAWLKRCAEKGIMKPADAEIVRAADDDDKELRKTKRDELADMFLVELADPIHVAKAKGIVTSLQHSRHELVRTMLASRPGTMIERVFVVEVSGVDGIQFAKPLRIKCRPDYMLTGADSGYVADIKTCNGDTAKASPASFAKRCRQLGYHVSAAMYSDILTHVHGYSLPWYWIACEMKFPWLMCPYELSHDDHLQGRHEYEQALIAYEAGARNGEGGLPGYCPGVDEQPQVLELFNWKPRNPTPEPNDVVPMLENESDIPEFLR